MTIQFGRTAPASSMAYGVDCYDLAAYETPYPEAEHEGEDDPLAEPEWTPAATALAAAVVALCLAAVILLS